MEPEKKTNGAFVGLIVIVIILLIGGIYIWQSNMAERALQEAQVSEQDSTELNTLEQDLQGVDTSFDIDAETVY